MKKNIEVKTMDNVKIMSNATKNRHEFNKIVKTYKEYFTRFEHFVEAVALVIVASFALYYSTRVGMTNRDVLAVRFSGVLIAIIGGFQFLKTFKR
ncbi:MAG: hypothetical protein WCJ60_02230 [bacterium]